MTWNEFRNGNLDIYLNYSDNHGMTWLTIAIKLANAMRLDNPDTIENVRRLSKRISSTSNGHVYMT